MTASKDTPCPKPQGLNDFETSLEDTIHTTTVPPGSCLNSDINTPQKTPISGLSKPEIDLQHLRERLLRRLRCHRSPSTRSGFKRV